MPAVETCVMFTLTRRRAARRGEEVIIVAGSKNNPKEQETTPVAARFCGAKTRAGTACKRRPLKGKTRCRLHGGLAGAPKGNLNAVKTGAHIDPAKHPDLFRDLLDPEDRQFWDEIVVEKRHQLEQELMLLTLRERFMLQRIAQLKKQEFTTVEIEEESGTDADKGPYSRRTVKRLATLGQIQAIEEALTRIQNTKAKALELLLKMDQEQQPAAGNAVDKFLAALGQAAAEVWAGEELASEEEDETDEAGEAEEGDD